MVPAPVECTEEQGKKEEILNHSPAEWCHHRVGASEGSE